MISKLAEMPPSTMNELSMELLVMDTTRSHSFVTGWRSGGDQFVVLDTLHRMVTVLVPYQ